MCGIAGIAFRDPARPPDRNLLRRMTETLRHRGPDGDGYYAGPGAGLGFRRLSIVDLATGDQPIAGEDGSVVVVCNGEIYNHAALRAQLTAAGHRFTTASDVEVIVHLYEEHGDAFVHRLRGMFALALWDAKRARLVLARDRLGIKPLYYASTGDGVVFGSEQKAILASGTVDVEPDLAAMRELLTDGRIAAPRTLVASIRMVPAGHLLTWSAGRLETRRYWDVTFPARDGYDLRRPAADWADELRARLDDAVRSHLQGDVPIGAWLSGGVDSSSIAALASRHVAGRLPTWTLRFDDPRFDELAGRRALDAFPEYRLDGHAVACGAADFAEMPKAVWHTEGSIAVTFTVAQLRVARASAKRVKVVLTGEGSDELFGGYSWYPTLAKLAPVFLLPRPVRRMISRVPPIARRWPGAASTIPGPREMNVERFSHSVSRLPSQHIPERLLAPGVLAAMRAADDEAGEMPPPPDMASWHPFARMQYFDLTRRLADSVVMSLDRASMAHSVEARVPFLDHELVEFCARIPPRVKLRGAIVKHVLRQAMAGVLPREIAMRPKVPLQVPIHQWLREPLPAFARELVDASALRRSGWFVPDRVGAMLAAHRDGREDCAHALAAVLTVELWERQFRRARLGGTD